MHLRRDSRSEPLNASAEAFLRDILAVCKRHGLAISHEDGHGGFLIVEADDFHAGWLSEATDDRPEAEAIRSQRRAAEYHTSYERYRDAGDSTGWTAHYAQGVAEAFGKAWYLRFGTVGPEAWS